ncbi:cupin domain-containing protein [Acidobacteriia bacterium AH_259_A11_L15]|nr:cupin domain-containing protein [Acidobacteriia bacterium AH_259_A11_L15]
MADEFYPAEILALPEADIPFEGVRGRLLQGEKGSVVFFDIAPIGAVPAHAHGAQWGMVLEGEMELTLGGKTRTYRRGDRYYIPAGVEHSAHFKTRTFVIDFFADRDRYQPKQGR